MRKVIDKLTHMVPFAARHVMSMISNFLMS